MRIQDLARVVEERVTTRFYGKYAGVVTDNEDPLEIGRLRAKVPAVFGEDQETGWALPCAPFGGGKDRGFLFVPEVGDTVWIEFAGGGDPNFPIWAGTFWGAPQGGGGQDDLGSQPGTEAPSADGTTAGPGLAVLRTAAGHRLFFDDKGEVVVVANGNEKTEIRLTKDGEVVITANKIRLGDGADEPVVLGSAFKQLFNQHTHPTGVGPSGPPAQPIASTHLSSRSFTE